MFGLRDLDNVLVCVYGVLIFFDTPPLFATCMPIWAGDCERQSTLILVTSIEPVLLDLFFSSKGHLIVKSTL